MPRRNRRKGEKREQKRSLPTIHLSTEGNYTEPNYFEHLKSPSDSGSYKLRFAGGRGKHKTDPMQVLDRMKRHLSGADEAWIVVDRDSWLDDRFQLLINWRDSNDKCNFALSNPCFEFWLLLHFEDCKRNQNCKYYERQLKKYDVNYKKNINRKLYTEESVRKAVSLGLKDTVNDPDCLQNPGCSTVCKLVSKFIE